MNRMPLAFNDVAVGEALPSLVKPITLVNMVIYAAAVWDFIPLHFDRDYAQRRGFSQPCVDGQMLGAFLAQVVTDWIGEAGTLKTLTFRLREFVYPGDTLTCKGCVINKRAQDGEYLLDCELWIENQRGVKVVTPARATVALLCQA
jgi:acyl dehydratase